MITAVKRIAGTCLILGPTLQELSTFFWKDGYQGITAGTLIVVAAVCWIVGLVAVFRLVEPKAPRYAAVGLPLMIYGCVGGVTFGVQGMHEEIFGVSHSETIRLLREHPAAAYGAFWFAGLLFPLSVFVLGVMLTRIKAVSAPTGVLLCVGALVFPLSRIPREAAVAHVADLLLLLPFVHLGLFVARTRFLPSPPSAPLGAGTDAR